MAVGALVLQSRLCSAAEPRIWRHRLGGTTRSSLELKCMSVKEKSFSLHVKYTQSGVCTQTVSTRSAGGVPRSDVLSAGVHLAFLWGELAEGERSHRGLLQLLGLSLCTVPVTKQSSPSGHLM